MSEAATTQIHMERRPDGVTLTAPRLGAWKLSSNMIGFGLLACGFLACFTAYCIVHEFRWSTFLGLIRFWAGAISILVTPMILGQVRTTITVSKEALTVVRRGVLGNRKWHWPKTEIADVCVTSDRGPGALPQLQIVTCEGKRKGLLTGYQDSTLQSACSVLRGNLALTDGRPAPDNYDAAPPSLPPTGREKTRFVLQGFVIGTIPGSVVGSSVFVLTAWGLGLPVRIDPQLLIAWALVGACFGGMLVAAQYFEFCSLRIRKKDFPPWSPGGWLLLGCFFCACVGAIVGGFTASFLAPGQRREFEGSLSGFGFGFIIGAALGLVAALLSSVFPRAVEVAIGRSALRRRGAK